MGYRETIATVSHQRFLTGLIGAPIAHSASPAMHEQAAGALGINSALVNGTPVGMLPNRGTPVPEALLHRGLWVADAVYSPLWTPLLTAAKAKGAEIMTGRELAIYQAADAFELFTGFAAADRRDGKCIRRRDGETLRYRSNA